MNLLYNHIVFNYLFHTQVLLSYLEVIMLTVEVNEMNREYLHRIKAHMELKR